MVVETDSRDGTDEVEVSCNRYGLLPRSSRFSVDHMQLKQASSRSATNKCEVERRIGNKPGCASYSILRILAIAAGHAAQSHLAIESGTDARSVINSSAIPVAIKLVPVPVDGCA